MGFWNDFAEGFVPAYQAGLERKHEEKLLNDRLQGSRREKLLDLVGSVQQERAKVASEVGKYTNSVSALSDRLRDEEGNLIPGAEALLENPIAADKILKKINEIEQKAAEDDNLYTPPLYGEILIDSFTTYTEGGGRVPTPDVSIEGILTGIQSDEDISQEEYEKYYLDLRRAVPSSSPEPVVQVNPELMRKPDPETYKAGREVFAATLIDLLNQDIAGLENVDDETAAQRYTDLKRLRDSIAEDGLESAAMPQLADMYGAKAFGRLKDLAKSDPTIQGFESDAMLERARRNYYISSLTEIANDDSLSQERRDTAKRILKDRFGVNF